MQKIIHSMKNDLSIKSILLISIFLLHQNMPITISDKSKSRTFVTSFINCCFGIELCDL